MLAAVGRIRGPLPDSTAKKPLMRRSTDITDTAILDLRKMLDEESRVHPQNIEFLRRIEKSVDAVVEEIKEMRTEIIQLRLSAAGTVSRAEVEKIADDAGEVVTERVNNLWKFVTVSHVVIGALLSFIAAKVFSNGH